ncbi:MAG: hypothetical protein LUB59_07550 [Candidatus Gastranaerophilales bacterium]|nr:hypothetical protein [Candidatus Gastranaerophilales bacterium]
MVDNRAAGFYGVAGAFNFKSGDISGTAAKTSDDRASQGTEYGRVDAAEEEQQAVNSNKYVDNSAQLNATLNSLAMMNVASVINSKLPKYTRFNDYKKIMEEAEDIISSISPDEDKEDKKHNKQETRLQKDDDDSDDNEYY